MLGYLKKYGLVGKYRNHDVYVIDYDDLTEEMRFDENNIYAVRTGKNVLDLVLEEIYIGTMDDDGEIRSFNHRRKYQWPERLPVVEKKEVAEALTAKQSEPKPLDVELGYGAYSAVVDEFFKGLDKLWKEIDEGIN